ncbi:MAG: rhomboid family intramembrane serine protease [Bermanella sp.]
MQLAFTCKPNFAIAPVLSQLDEQRIVYQLKRDDLKMELWVEDPRVVVGVQEYCQSYSLSQQRSLNIENMKAVPVTSLLLIATLLVALLTQLGANFTEWFFIARMQYDPRSWFYYEGIASIWHAISPVFLHFSAEHLIFNVLSFWYLGSVLERVLGFFFYSLTIILLALLSNFSQLLVSGPLFGGLSGVVYGLLAFAWVYQLSIANLTIPKGLFYVAGIWLLLGISGAFESIGLFNMANTAHVAGLVGGLILSLVLVVITKLKQKN